MSSYWVPCHQGCAHLFGMFVFVLMCFCVLFWVLIMFPRGAYMVFWLICKAWTKYGTMVNIAKTHLSRHKIVHVLRSFVDPISVDVTDNSEHWATYAAYLMANCDATMIRTVVCWIARDLIVILFTFKNLNILCAKRLYV